MQLSIEVVAERVRQEIDARVLQGYEVDGLHERWEQARTDYHSLLDIHAQLKNLPLRTDWPYDEPSNFQAIRDARPAVVPLPDFYLSEHEIHQKIHGAWLGRVCGCILGKPLEMAFTQDDIKAYLNGAHAYPLD